MKGLIFSIEEFAVYDGKGIRLNVFFKGCHLRCKWCHNPEGWLPKIQMVRSPNGCIGCNKCRDVCPSPNACIGCGECAYNCPQNLIRFSGEVWDSDALSQRILKLKHILTDGGGVTFSGGEVLMQPEFLCEMLEKTSALHKAIETSGYGTEDNFKKVLSLCDFVYFDLKIMDSDKHKYYTGLNNSVILNNARILMNSGVDYVFRVPFIKGINTDEENLCAMRVFISKAPKKPKIEFLSYNTMAGAKYKMLGMEYKYSFEKPTEGDISLAKRIFSDFDISFKK